MSAVPRKRIARLRRSKESEELERAALADLLKRRRVGRFVSGPTMDDSLARMLVGKRQSHAITKLTSP